MNKFRKPHGGGGRNKGSFRSGGSGRPDFRGPARPQFGGRRPEGPEQFDAICSKCGKACQVPFRPNGQKPVYCRECFGQPSSDRDNFVRRDSPVGFVEPREPRAENREVADLKQQVIAINSKIDSILRIVESLRHDAAPVEAFPVASAPKAAGARKAAQKAAPRKKIAQKKPGAKK